jgi:hypothetical protein
VFEKEELICNINKLRFQPDGKSSEETSAIAIVDVPYPLFGSWKSYYTQCHFTHSS